MCLKTESFIFNMATLSSSALGWSAPFVLLHRVQEEIKVLLLFVVLETNGWIVSVRTRCRLKASGQDTVGSRRMARSLNSDLSFTFTIRKVITLSRALSRLA